MNKQWIQIWFMVQMCSYDTIVELSAIDSNQRIQVNKRIYHMDYVDLLLLWIVCMESVLLIPNPDKALWAVFRSQRKCPHLWRSHHCRTVACLVTAENPVPVFFIQWSIQVCTETAEGPAENSKWWNGDWLKFMSFDITKTVHYFFQGGISSP